VNRLFLVLVSLMLISSIGCSKDRAEIRLGAQRGFESAEGRELRVTVSENDRVFLRDFEFVLSDARPSAGPFSTAHSGTLKIACVVLLDGNETNGRGEIELPLRSDWRWGVDFFISQNDPIDTCFGCFGSRAFALDPALGYGEAEKLYVVWGGNSISDPVIY